MYYAHSLSDLIMIMCWAVCSLVGAIGIHCAHYCE